MLRTDRQTDKVHSYNPLPTLWRGITNNKVLENTHRLMKTKIQEDKLNMKG